jgi:hypothetical protein
VVSLLLSSSSTALLPSHLHLLTFTFSFFFTIGKVALTLHFHPQEEVLHNFNIIMDVRRKPNKLTLNIKGEGYAVHPTVMLEQSEEEAALAGNSKGNVSYTTLRPGDLLLLFCVII